MAAKPIDCEISEGRQDLWSESAADAATVFAECLIATPVGVNADLVQDGAGLAATTHEQWLEQISNLANASERRERMEQAGRKKVIAEYSLQVQQERLCEQIETLVKAT